MEQRRWLDSPSWPYLLVFLCVAALYLPVYIGLAQDVWPIEDDFHGPIILAVCLWLAWQRRRDFSSAPADDPAGRVIGWVALVVGLMFYALGRSQDIYMLSLGSQLLVFPGAILAIRGWPSLRPVWFPVFFLLFLIPLPDFVISGLTGPLKQLVSVIAENLLYAVGYPIARSGVILSVGPYELLVADACSGLNSIFTLVALTALYLYLMRYRSLSYNLMLLACAVPIAIAANVVRVVVLVLVTYHFGDEAGQGFVHSFAGLLLFAVALSLVMALDGVLMPVARRLGLNLGQTA
ncbi:exosortase B [Methylolobus aquaticus]|nr:exosortase B [Methylolobus aquaticus]